MSQERKIQIWLRPDQVDVLTECLVYVKRKAEEPNSLQNGIDAASKRLLVRRVNEILEMLSNGRRKSKARYEYADAAIDAAREKIK
jgi:hypothetical protein